jgi:hypothetical protein
VLDQVPAEAKARREWLARNFSRPMTEDSRKALIEEIGDAASAVKHAESFELCEYGRRPSLSELRALFPVR